MILFFGDNHGEFDYIIEAVRRHRPAGIVLLGDMDAPAPLEKLLAPILEATEVWFIHGNHDSDRDDYFQHVFESSLADRNLHGRVVEIDGVRVAGLGGVFRESVWYPPGEAAHECYEAHVRHLNLRRPPKDRSPLEPSRAARHGAEQRRHTTSIYPAIYDRLALERADILVTHEAPSAHQHGFEALDELARALGARSLFHGHHHVSLAYGRQHGESGFDAYGVGLRGITDQQGRVVKPGAFDADRIPRAKRRPG